MPSFITISKRNMGTWKSNEEICDHRPCWNRKHLDHEYLEPFPYKSWYNDNLSCMLHWIYVNSWFIYTPVQWFIDISEDIGRHQLYLTRNEALGNVSKSESWCPPAHCNCAIHLHPVWVVCYWCAVITDFNSLLLALNQSGMNDIRSWCHGLWLPCYKVKCVQGHKQTVNFK